VFVRLSLGKPRAESREEAITTEDHLLSHFASLGGFIGGYRLENVEYVGRVTLWEDAVAADRAANDAHTMASRSRLIQLQLPTEKETLELSFEGIPVPSVG
jgi:hypothetical protein